MKMIYYFYHIYNKKKLINSEGLFMWGSLKNCLLGPLGPTSILNNYIVMNILTIINEIIKGKSELLGY